MTSVVYSAADSEDELAVLHDVSGDENHRGDHQPLIGRVDEEDDQYLAVFDENNSEIETNGNTSDTSNTHHGKLTRASYKRKSSMKYFIALLVSLILIIALYITFSPSPPSVLLSSLLAMSTPIREFLFSSHSPQSIPSQWWLDPEMSAFSQSRIFHSSNSTAPSRWYSQLLYDDFLAIPRLPTTLLARKMLGSAALRHVRLVDGRIKIHLPLSMKPTEEPPSHDLAVDGIYDYERESQQLFGYQFDPTPMPTVQMFIHQPHYWAKIRPTVNTSYWALPSDTDFNLGRERNIPKSEPFTGKRQHIFGEFDSGNEFLFNEASNVCHNTQTDMPGRSAGRLNYFGDQRTMMEYNTRSLQRLHAQLSRVAHVMPNVGTAFRTNAMGEHDGRYYIGVDIEYGDVDYDNKEQCNHVMDHAYIMEGMWTHNVWHRVCDYAMPFHSLMYDPCFFPLPIDPMTGNVQSDRAPHNPFTDANIIVRDYTQFGEQPWDTGLEIFWSNFTKDWQPRARGQALPRIWTVPATQQSGPVCIKDAVIGMPWYFVPDNFITDGPDPTRIEWEKYRMNQFLTKIEFGVDKARISQSLKPLTTTRVGRFVSPKKHRELWREFVAALELNNIHDHIDGIRAMNKSTEWWRESSPPPRAAIPYEDWLKQQPKQNVDERVKRGLAELPRPFKPEQVAAIKSTIDNVDLNNLTIYYHHLAPFQISDNLPALSTGAPNSHKKLRCLLIARQPGVTRSYVDRNATAFGIRNAGFDVEVADFGPTKTIEAWYNHIENIRSFDVVVGVHGAGMTNLLYMLPGTSLLVEFYPECWCWSYPLRQLFAHKFGAHAQIRNIEIGVPCPTGRNYCDGNEERDSAENIDIRGYYVNRHDFSSSEEVYNSVYALFKDIHDNFLTHPIHQERQFKQPIIFMQSK